MRVKEIEHCLEILRDVAIEKNITNPDLPPFFEKAFHEIELIIKDVAERRNEKLKNKIVL